MSAFIIGLTVYCFLCVLVGYVASQRGRNAGGLFLLSLVTSPLVGFLVTIGLPARRLPTPPARELSAASAGRGARNWREPLQDPVYVFCYVVVAFGVGTLIWLVVWRP